jgi:hypothetical protein
VERLPEVALDVEPLTGFDMLTGANIPKQRTGLERAFIENQVIIWLMKYSLLV